MCTSLAIKVLGADRRNSENPRKNLEVLSAGKVEFRVQALGLGGLRV